MSKCDGNHLQPVCSAGPQCWLYDRAMDLSTPALLGVQIELQKQLIALTLVANERQARMEARFTAFAEIIRQQMKAGLIDRQMGQALLKVFVPNGN